VVIFLCTYNGARFLAAQLDSIAAQTHQDWVVWASDDGSSDATLGILEAYRAHRLEREAQVLQRLAAGDRTIAEMVPVLYSAVDQRLWPAASLSVLAHLIKLVEDGAAISDGAPGLSSQFRLA
jgi:hypothetical protein